MKYNVEAKVSCKYCHGSGAVTDYVPYGSTSVPMQTTCDCFVDNLPDDFDDDWDEVDMVVQANEIMDRNGKRYEVFS